MKPSLRFLAALAVLAVAGCHKRPAAPEGTAAAASAPAATTAGSGDAGAPSVAAQAAPAAPVAPVPGELPIIAKARAYVGTEAALDGIRSIHYVGTLVTSDPTDPKKQTRAVIEIIFQKPDQQRVTTTSDKTIETTALDDYDGWMRVTAAADPTKWQQTLFSPDGVRRLRANTWENLAFYRGMEKEGGTVRDIGRTAKDGVTCEEVAFIHAPNVIFYRYFDVTNGHLVYSETETGGSIREEGQMIVDGVRFPKSIITVSKNQAGQEQTVKITFDRITLNEKFADSIFAVPSLAPQ